ncbi:hypothetical protein DLAC_07847 [Tieghemostelium lacteum]|uniref:SMP-LTD domain-containing protein n=1 Tax=Tieghemostelium lacteum TaxID=361077 RepID=A0A151ZAJ0_TIELA|nr:hypothetical protein DLAC_07847 [Tieghemostelium lacteum]|eukprot:KYQ90963.1 hypothetical protein DLAC_07847 [Tieghemostelium lacteum]
MSFIFGFLVGVIFSSTLVIYLLFQLLSKKVDPNEHINTQKRNIKKQQHNSSSNKGGFSFLGSNTNNNANNQSILIDISDKPPTSIETCHWINFITSRILSDINKSTQFSEKIYNLLNNTIFDENSKPDFIGKIQFSDISYGTTTPEIGTVKLISPPDSPVSVLEFDIIYSGDASITVYTELWLNWPQKHTACLPVKTKLSIKQFTGKFILYIPNNSNPTCSLYLKEQPNLTLRMITKMGYETVLKEPGKIGSFIQNHLLKFINQKLVAPNKINFNLFSFLHPTPLNSTHHQSLLSNSVSQQHHSSSSNKSSPSLNGSLKKSKSNNTIKQRTSKDSIKFSQDENHFSLSGNNNIISSTNNHHQNGASATTHDI